MANLSKDWTLKDAIGHLRVLTNQIGSNIIQDNFIVDYIHNALTEVAQQLSVVNLFDYGTEANLSVSFASNYGTASLTGFTTSPIDQIIKITDLSLDDGKEHLVYKEPRQFNNLRNIVQASSGAVYWTRNGETIQFYSGDLTPSATVKMFYLRSPVKASAPTDYLDIKDCYVGLVLAKAKLAIYESVNKKPPVNISQYVNNAIAQLRNSSMDKFQNIPIKK